MCVPECTHYFDLPVSHSMQSTAYKMYVQTYRIMFVQGEMINQGSSNMLTGGFLHLRHGNLSPGLGLNASAKNLYCVYFSTNILSVI